MHVCLTHIGDIRFAFDALRIDRFLDNSASTGPDDLAELMDLPVVDSERTRHLLRYRSGVETRDLLLGTGIALASCEADALLPVPLMLAELLADTPIAGLLRQGDGFAFWLDLDRCARMQERAGEPGETS